MRALVMSVVIAVLVSGCGGGSSPTAAPTTPATSASSSSQFNLHQFPDLEALLPPTLAGSPGAGMSVSGDQIEALLSGTGSDKAVSAWMSAIGPASKVQIAAESIRGDTAPPAVLMVFRIPGASGTTILAALRQALQAQSLAVTDKTVAGKPVMSVLDTGANAPFNTRPTLFYAKDDMVFSVNAESDAVAQEALTALP